MMEKNSSDSSEALLGYQDELPRRRNSRKCTQWLKEKYLSLIMVALLTYIATILTVHYAQQPRPPPSLPYSPANAVLKYETKQAWDKGDDSPWLHGEEQDVEDAWQDLQIGLNVRLPEHEMKVTQPDWDSIDDAVEIVGGDYLGALGVYHSIHCLYLLRVAVNQGGYNLSSDDAVSQLNLHHYNHCIDFIRDAVMCHPDLTVYRAIWLKDSHEHNNKRLRSTSQSQCAAWGPIAEWARDRALNESDRSVRLRPGPFEVAH